MHRRNSKTFNILYVVIVIFVLIRAYYDYFVFLEMISLKSLTLVRSPLHSSSSFHSVLQNENEKKRLQFEKSIHCIDNYLIENENRKKNAVLLIKSAINFETNKVEREIEEHYKFLLNHTARMRREHPHKINGIRGEWLEQHWIKQFSQLPLSEFGGYVPLFVQWADYYVHYSNHYNEKILDKIVPVLRKDVLYVTVSSADPGILGLSVKYSLENISNVLVFSAGGVGHIPIPLLGVTQDFDTEFHEEIINKKINFETMFESGYFLHHQSFAGWLRNIRHEMNRIATNYSSINPSFVYLRYYGANWTEVLKRTMINLTPRGFGRTSFRLSEVIQKGYLFLNIYSDVEWTAYDNSPCSITNLGFSINISEYSNWLEGKKWNLHSKEYLKKKQQIFHCRNSHYTYEGVMNQIKSYLKNDFPTSLTCKYNQTTWKQERN